MVENQFGGTWTQEKLDRLQAYLVEYTKIFHRNDRAQFLRTVYVDAFAGTGQVTLHGSSASDPGLFPELQEAEVQSFLKGSAQRALDLEPYKFDHYVFVEKDPAYATELHRLKNLHVNSGISIQIEQADANAFLPDWCSRQNWTKTRAVVFLDPFSMEVEWSTLEALAACKVDLWLLWPIGQAINRMLPKKRLPDESWQKRLTAAFGTDEWIERFYNTPVVEQLSLVEVEELGPVKVAGFSELEAFFLERLRTIFPFVAPKPLYLFNSKNTPIFLFCFASHNQTALKIASHLLTH